MHKKICLRNATHRQVLNAALEFINSGKIQERTNSKSLENLTIGLTIKPGISVIRMAIGDNGEKIEMNHYSEKEVVYKLWEVIKMHENR